MLCFFTALALQKTGGVPEPVKVRLRTILSNAQKGSSYGYDVKAPVDADDTAFALRTRLLLGDTVTPEEVVAALEPFRCGDSWFTFPAKIPEGITPPFYSVYQGAVSVVGPHPEVHLNILALYQELYGTAVSRILPLPLQQGVPVSYFYPSSFYGAWLYNMLCRQMELEDTTLKSAVLRMRKQDGSWPGCENGFSEVQETAIAMLTLYSFASYSESDDAVLKYIIKQQQADGSFPGGTLWKYQFPTESDSACWSAVDSNSIVSTGCVVLALQYSMCNRQWMVQ
jgi:hypothetical protein